METALVNFVAEINTELREMGYDALVSSDYSRYAEIKISGTRIVIGFGYDGCTLYEYYNQHSYEFCDPEFPQNMYETINAYIRSK